MNLILFFEGDAKLKKGFEAFFRRMIPNSVAVNGIACGSKPVERFLESKDEYSGDFCILLMDADKLIDGGKYKNENLVSILKNKAKWKNSFNDVNEERLHFMVIEMESWFLSDINAMKKVFGSTLRDSYLPDIQEIEALSKSKVWSALETVTSNKYHKTLSALNLLFELNPETVASRSRHCRILFDTLTQKLNSLDPK